MTRPVILLEFNELTPSLMDRFIAQGHLPNFARLRNEAQCYITDAEEEAPNLEPWIQWVTVHSGLRFREHGIFHLGDGKRVSNDAIWDVASKHGHDVWICGSMNAFHTADVSGWILPDPWSVHVQPNVAQLRPYFSFVRSQVLNYARPDSRIPLADALRFASFMLRRGLRLGTLRDIAAQLISERFRNVRWKRATILDRLQFDLFRWVYRHKKPTLSTFFINSTAHFQHCYWRNLDPSSFSIQPDPEDQVAYADAILYGYQCMDRIIGEAMKLAGNEATIVFASALGQQPCLSYEADGGKSFYKPDDYTRLLKVLGIDPSRCSAEPVMSEEFHLRLASTEDTDAAERALTLATIERQRAFKLERDGTSIIVGCAVFHELPADAMIDTATGAYRFSDLFYFVDTTKSGMHHPEGLLWIRVPGVRGSAVPGTVPLTTVAPTILRLLGLPIPDSMPGAPLPVSDGAGADAHGAQRAA